jgi:hypothetical protein
MLGLDTETEDMQNFTTKSDLEAPITGMPPDGLVEDATPPAPTVITTINTEKQMPPIVDSNTPATPAPVKGMSQDQMNKIWYIKEITVGLGMIAWIIASFIVMARKK